MPLLGTALPVVLCSLAKPHRPQQQQSAAAAAPERVPAMLKVGCWHYKRMSMIKPVTVHSLPATGSDAPAACQHHSTMACAIQLHPAARTLCGLQQQQLSSSGVLRRHRQEGL